MSEQQPSPKPLQVRLPLLFALTLAVGMFIGQKLPRYDAHVRLLSGPSANAGTLDEILRYVEAKYVDSVDVAALKETAIASVLDLLDPHSIYISPEERKAIEDEMHGGFEGIGVEYVMVEDTMQVVEPLPDGPAEKAGILAGDRIVRIDDAQVAGVKMDTDQLFKRLRGAAGSAVKISVRRNAEPALRDFALTRDLIPVRSVQAAYMLDERTGYIKVSRFNANTYEEFMEGLRPMAEQQGLQDLVLDLRGNPGGYLEEATEMLSQIFPEGKLLVYTKGRADARKEYKSSGRARFNIQNVAVLIDENSASASEIVAGAVQDHDRGWVLGRRSFGKGLVQEQYPLSDSGALRLTIARYFTPSGRCIQRDYKHGQDYDHEAERRLQNGELSDAAKIRQADSTRFYTGLGRVVYGSGGVTPDVFIPIDTSFSNDYYIALRRHLPQFSLRWMEGRDRSALPGTVQDFVKNYSASDDVLGEWAAYAKKEGAAPHEAQLAACRTELRLQFKARLAKLLFKDEGLYRVLNDDDPAVEQAVAVMRKALK
jgi:carboxyl-terminal processing protease